MRNCFTLAVVSAVAAGSAAHAAVHMESLTTLVNEVVEAPAVTCIQHPVHLPQGTTVSMQIGIANPLAFLFAILATFVLLVSVALAQDDAQRQMELARQIQELMETGKEEEAMKPPPEIRAVFQSVRDFG